MIIKATVATTILTVTLLTATAATALPRYSAQYGQRCSLCHVEPTGGGLRTLYASMALVPEELSFLQMEPEEVANIRPDVSPAITVGLDLRSLWYGGEGDRSGQLDMQGDVYAGFQMSRQFAAFIEVGKGGAKEYAGLAYVLPLDGYLKAGRFTPDYGWKWADHQMPARYYLLDEDGTPAPRSLTDSGLEVGMHQQWWEVTGSILQGGGTDNGDSYAARLALRQSWGRLNVAVGSSIIRRQFSETHARAWGGFGYLSYGPATWVFQVDETGNGVRNGLLVSQELTYRIVQGFHARGTYGFHDPDHAVKNGARNRYGVGVDSLISPFFGVLAMANYHQIDEGELVTGDDFWQGELVLHFLY
jgi:hypothetical protein